MKYFLTLTIIIILNVKFVKSQSVGVAINNTGTTPNINAMLDIDDSSNKKGILIPRLSSSQRTNISGLGTTEKGLTVFDETSNSYWFWDGTDWVEITTKGWRTIGNTGTVAGTNFLGTTDATDFVIKTNNAERVRVETDGDVLFGARLGVGNWSAGSNPQDKISIRDNYWGLRISNWNTTTGTWYKGATLTLLTGRGNCDAAANCTPLSAAGQYLGTIEFQGGNNGNLSGVIAANISSVSESDWNTAKSGNLEFYTKSTSDVTAQNRMTITSKGLFQFNTSNLVANESSFKISPIGGGSSTTSIPSIIDFWSTFDNYSADQGPRRTASIKAHYIGGVWGHEALSFCVGSSNDSGIEPAERVRIVASGNNLTAGGSWGTLSDKRLKSNIEVIPYGLTEIMKLKPVKYIIHDTKGFNDIPTKALTNKGRVEIGFLAQDIYKIIPNVVNKPKDETKQLWTMKYERLTPVLVKAIQEQQKEIIELKKQNKEILKLLNAKN